MLYYDDMSTKFIEKLARAHDSPRLFRTILVGTAILAGVISLWIGLRQSVWFDEAYSILLAKQPIGELLRLTALDTHPPLYYVLLKGWAGLFGWSELSLRLASVGSLVLTIVVAGLLLARLFGRKIALGVLPLLALAPLVLRYGFEIRMYADAMLVGVAATYVLVRAVQAKRAAHRNWWLAAYALLVVTGVYLLYYLAFLWIAHVVWLLVITIRKRRPWQSLIPYVLSYVGAVMLFVPWLPTFIAQTSNGALAPIGSPLNLEQLMGIATFNLLYQPLWMVSVGLTVLMIAVGAALVWLLPRAKRGLKDKTDEALLLALYIGVPIVLLMGISLVSSMYTERYLSHLAIGLIMLLGVTIVAAAQASPKRERRRTGWAVAIIYGAMLVGTVQLAVTGNFNFQRMQTPTVREAAASLTECASGTRLVMADPYVATELLYYMPDCPYAFVSEWDELRGGYAYFSGSSHQVKDVKTLTDPRITYVFYGTPDQPLPEYYQETARREFGALNVVEYTRAK